MTQSTSFIALFATAIGSAGLFWLLQDHWRYAVGVLPYLLFLACPAMHLFMHHGRKASGGRRDHHHVDRGE